MRHIFTLLAAIALSLLLGGGDCLAMGQADSTASQSSPSTSLSQRETILQAKRNDEAELAQWKSRLTQLSMGQAGLRSFRDYGKPGEDPTNVMRFASGPSDYASDVQECQMHISMLKANLKVYEKELAKLDKAEAETKGGTEGGDGGGGGGGH